MNNFLGKILILDSDKTSNQILDMYLKNSGYKSKIILSGKEIARNFSDYAPDMILLDLLAQNIDSMNFIKWVRDQSNIPIIIITYKDDIFSKILALDLGADDYILKPFEPKEVIARIKAVFRRYNIKTNKDDSHIISFGELSINFASYRVISNGKELKLPPKEFELLNLLANNPDKVFTRKELLDEVWGSDYNGDCRTVDVHIKRLRKNLGESVNWDISTIWGVGYRFNTN